MSRPATPWEIVWQGTALAATLLHIEGAHLNRNVLHHRGGRGLADAYERNVMVALTYAPPEEP